MAEQTTETNFVRETVTTQVRNCPICTHEASYKEISYSKSPARSTSTKSFIGKEIFPAELNKSANKKTTGNRTETSFLVKSEQIKSKSPQARLHTPGRERQMTSSSKKHTQRTEVSNSNTLEGNFYSKVQAQMEGRLAQAPNRNPIMEKDMVEERNRKAGEIKIVDDDRSKASLATLASDFNYQPKFKYVKDHHNLSRSPSRKEQLATMEQSNRIRSRSRENVFPNSKSTHYSNIPGYSFGPKHGPELVTSGERKRSPGTNQYPQNGSPSKISFITGDKSDRQHSPYQQRIGTASPSRAHPGTPLDPYPPGYNYQPTGTPGRSSGHKTDHEIRSPYNNKRWEFIEEVENKIQSAINRSKSRGNLNDASGSFGSDAITGPYGVRAYRNMNNNVSPGKYQGDYSGEGEKMWSTADKTDQGKQHSHTSPYNNSKLQGYYADRQSGQLDSSAAGSKFNRNNPHFADPNQPGNGSNLAGTVYSVYTEDHRGGNHPSSHQKRNPGHPYTGSDNQGYNFMHDSNNPGGDPSLGLGRQPLSQAQGFTTEDRREQAYQEGLGLGRQPPSQGQGFITEDWREQAYQEGIGRQPPSQAPGFTTEDRREQAYQEGSAVKTEYRYTTPGNYPGRNTTSSSNDLYNAQGLPRVTSGVKIVTGDGASTQGEGSLYRVEGPPELRYKGLENDLKKFAHYTKTHGGLTVDSPEYAYELNSNFLKRVWNLRFVSSQELKVLIADSVIFIGDKKNGLKCGRGKYITQRGGRVLYEGFFYDNLYHGEGKLHNPKYSDVRRNDWYANLDENDAWEHYEGHFSGGFPEGLGRIVMHNGDCITGVFLRGRLNGMATLRLADGKEFTGEWQDNILNGQLLNKSN
jgi:hypothetical protein